MFSKFKPARVGERTARDSVRNAEPVRADRFMSRLWCKERYLFSCCALNTGKKSILQKSYSRDRMAFKWFSHHHRSAPAVACRFARNFHAWKDFYGLSKLNLMIDDWAVKTIYCDCLFLLLSNSWKHDTKAAFRLHPNPLSPIRQTQFNGVSRTFDTESSPQSIDFQRQPNSDWAHRRAAARAFFCVVLLDSKPFPMIKLGSCEWTTCVEIVCCWVYARLDTCLNLLLFNVCLNEIVHLNEHEIPKRNPLCSQADFTELTCGWMGERCAFSFKPRFER